MPLKFKHLNVGADFSFRKNISDKIDSRKSRKPEKKSIIAKERKVLFLSTSPPGLPGLPGPLSFYRETFFIFFSSPRNRNGNA